MSRLQPTFSDRVRYILMHDETGTLIIPEPIGWKNDDNEFVRSKKMHGVMTQMTNNLKFTDSGRNFINTVRNTYGINADLRMVKDEKHPRTDVWTRAYDGFLDLSTWAEEDKKVSVKFDSSGLLKLIKSREGEKIELDRLDTIDGKVLTALNKETVALNGREILLDSSLEVKPEDSVSTAFRMEFNSPNNFRTASLAVPTSVNFKSDVLIHTVTNDVFTTTPDVAEVSSLFYADNDRPKTLNLDINVSGNILEVHVDDLSEASLFLVLAKFNNSTDFDIVEPRIELSPNIINNSSVITPQINISFQTSINLLEGESLSLQWYGKAKFGAFLNDGNLDVNFENIVATINISEDSFFDASQAQFFLPHEIGDRLINIISDRPDAFYSTVLGRTDINYPQDGEAALIGATNGFQVRGFEPTDDLYKSFTTSWKDFRDSYLNIWNLGMGIERIGFQERVRIEKLEYFYNRNILIHIGEEDENGKFQYTQVSNVKRTESKEHYFSGLEFGYDRVTDYEEANGLDEYNLANTYTTVINRLEKKYTKKSKYRGDSYGMEFARRQPHETAPTEDTKYDNSNFLIDLKRGVTDVFEQRLWADDFEKEPTGVFSPETAQNLRLSPFNTLLRHGFVIDSGLTKYPESYVRYGSSVANSNLKTQLIGGVEYAENGIIQNKALTSARYLPEIVEFEHSVSFDLLQQVQGKTVVLGEEIPNFHGLVAFRNEDGQIEKGFLQNLKPNGNGKWVLLKYNNRQEASQDVFLTDDNGFILTTENGTDYII